MSIQDKMTGFATLGATWVTWVSSWVSWVSWVLVGLSAGGLAGAVDRAVYLIRTSDNARRLKVEILTFLKRREVC